MDYKEAVLVLEEYLNNLDGEIDYEIQNSLENIYNLIEKTNSRFDFQINILANNEPKDLKIMKLQDKIKNIEGFDSTNKTTINYYSSRLFSNFSYNYSLYLSGTYKEGKTKLIQKALDLFLKDFNKNDEISIEIGCIDVYMGEVQDFNISKISI